MEIVKILQQVTDTLNEVDTYYDGLTNELSEVDLKIQDLLHYIESHKISILWSYKYLAELRRLRLDRRRIKNDMFILGRYSEHKNKLISSGNRQFLMTELYKAEKQLEAPYKNRQYNDGEIEEILNKSKEK